MGVKPMLLIGNCDISLFILLPSFSNCKNEIYNIWKRLKCYRNFQIYSNKCKNVQIFVKKPHNFLFNSVKDLDLENGILLLLSMPCKEDEIFGNFCYNPYQNLAVKLERFFEPKLLV